MCRHRCFGNLEVTRQLAGAQRSRAKQGKDPAPRRVCQSSENIAHVCILAKYRNTVKSLAPGATATRSCRAILTGGGGIGRGATSGPPANNVAVSGRRMNVI